VSAMHVYFDTCALMRFAEGRASGADERNLRGRERVQELIRDSTISLATSEIAIIEFHEALGKDVRGNRFVGCDETWLGQSIADLMQLVAAGRVEIVPVPPRALESALVLMKTAHREHGIAFYAWDAVHLITASAWATKLGSLVHLATCDSDYARFFAKVPHFAKFIEVMMVV